MTCRRAQELDLVAYLVEPEAPVWDEFRAHFPVCPECSASLATLSRIERELRSRSTAEDPGHPPARTLADFAADPRSLASPERARVEEHLADCRACADEIAALRAFDFAALESSAAVGVRELVRRAARVAIQAVVSRMPQRPADETGGASSEPVVPAVMPTVAFQSRSAEASLREPGPRDLVGVLAGLRGGSAGHTFGLHAGEYRIGRAPHCEIRLAGRNLAREAAILTADVGHYKIRRLSRQCALAVNGIAVEAAPLADGDIVEVGGERLQLRSVGAITGPRAP